MSAKQDKERRLEQIRRSCLICGNLHFNSAPCCDKSYCVSDLQRDFEKLNEFVGKLMEAVKFAHSPNCYIMQSDYWKNYTPKENADNF